MALTHIDNKYFTDQDCLITYNPAPALNEKEHTHDFLEIVYVFSGNSLHIVDGHEYPATAGDLLFINLGSTHSFTCGKKFEYANIILKPEFINRGLAGTENAFSLLDLADFRALSDMVDRTNLLVHLSDKEIRGFEGLLKLALTELNNSDPGRELMLRSVFNALLTITFRKMSLPLKAPAVIGEELLSYINDNCSRRLSLEQLAADNHYSPAYFSRLFRNQTGITFTEYVNRCRLKKAEKLLRETELSVGDICFETGFSNRTQFFRLFANRYGTSPLKYRKLKSNTF